LAKPWNRRRALRIFRDETGLATNPHLWSAIEGTLDESEWFVLLASPEATASEWVNKEVAHWLATKSVDHLLPVVTDGTWEWDPNVDDFTAASSAVPDVLRGAFVAEPRHLDVRWARSATDLDLRNSRFRSAVADLAAPMHGVPKDELEGEDIRQQRRTRRVALSAAAAVVLLLVVSVVFGVLAVVQRNRANTDAKRANTDATTAEHALLVAESQALLGSNRQLATLLAIEADRRNPGGDARDALLNAVLAEPELQRTFATVDEYGYDVQPLVGNRVVIAKNATGSVPDRDVLQVWDWQTGLRQAWSDAPPGDATTGPADIATTADGLVLAVIFRDGTIQLYSGRTLQPQGPLFSSGLGRLMGASGNIWFSANGRSLAACHVLPTGCASVKVFSRVANRWVTDPPLRGVRNAIALSSDGTVIASAAPTATGSEIVVSDVASGRPLFGFAAVPAYEIALDWTRRRVVVTTQTGGTSDAVWYDLNSSTPAPNAIDVGSSVSSGEASVYYDATDNRLGINTNNGLGIFDAATLTPLAPVPILPTNAHGEVVFLDSNHVLTATDVGGPLSLWDLKDLSVIQ